MVTVEGRLRGSNHRRTSAASEGAWPWTGRPEMALQTVPGTKNGFRHCWVGSLCQKGLGDYHDAAFAGKAAGAETKNREDATIKNIWVSTCTVST